MQIPIRERRPAVTDPLDVLREPNSPIDPDPAFARRLRARLERALELPRGVAVSTAAVQLNAAVSTPAEVSAPGVGAAIPYLAVRDGQAAIDWYVEVLGASLLGDPIVMPDGRIGHAELALGAGMLYLAEEFPDYGTVAPQPNAASVSLVLHVTDVEARVAATRLHGGTITKEIAEAYGSRNATVVDPFGHRWMLQQSITTVPATEAPAAPWHQGDIGYVSIQIPDPDLAADFYSAVLGWTYSDVNPNGRHVGGQAMSLGIWGGEQPDLFCCYAVGDVDAAVVRVRAAGGVAGNPTEAPFGRVAECTDVDGRKFAVFAPPAGAPDTRPPLNGTGHGDLSYVTMLVSESASTRAFYGAVLGWDFTPGRVDDGWEVSGIVPMTGLAGGSDDAIVLPMWRVDDIVSAVARVRAAGGTATDPEQQSYGLMSECVDNQGTRFYLGQH
jgi:predicted enzyme related to lactoylglutathione lyase